MPAPNFKRINLDLIEPEFLMKCLELISNCLSRGVSYHATRGYDTYDTQNALYAQGRSTPGPVVTHAKGGQSAHNFGLAIDFVCDADSVKAGIQPDWSTKAYKVLVEEAEKLGLHSGAGYRDYPHVGVQKYVTGKELLPLHTEWQKSSGDTLTRLKQVWKILNP